jgi:SAM-dependent MidA family methyltransferase
LKAGYVITIDYGSTWDELISPAPFRHLRTFGPGNRLEDSAPYRQPTLNDITSDVNFSHMAAEGRAVGLNVLYFGPQAALAAGTPIVLGVPPPKRKLTDREAAEFEEWSDEFLAGDAFKLLVQQKRGTDDAYSYPEDNSRPVDVAESDLNALQRKKAARIEEVLKAGSR